MPIRSTTRHYLMLSNSALNVKVLASSEVLEPANKAKKVVKKKPDPKVTKKVSSEESSDTLDKESDEEEKQEDEVKPRKNSVPKGKVQTSVRPKKRKGEETNLSSRKRVKPAKAASGSGDDRDREDNGKTSEDDQSHSSPEKPAKVILNYLSYMQCADCNEECLVISWKAKAITIF